MAAVSNSTSQHWMAGALVAPLRKVVGWYGISQERSALRQMSAERLSDIGLSQREVEWETARPFWQAQRDE